LLNESVPIPVKSSSQSVGSPLEGHEELERESGHPSVSAGDVADEVLSAERARYLSLLNKLPPVSSSDASPAAMRPEGGRVRGSETRDGTETSFVNLTALKDIYHKEVSATHAFTGLSRSAGRTLVGE
jgi:hypothetical protein